MRSHVMSSTFYTVAKPVRSQEEIGCPPFSTLTEGLTVRSEVSICVFKSYAQTKLASSIAFTLCRTYHTAQIGTIKQCIHTERWILLQSPAWKSPTVGRCSHVLVPICLARCLEARASLNSALRFALKLHQSAGLCKQSKSLLQIADG